MVGLAAGAEHAGVSTVTIRRWIKAGRITGYRVGPKLLKVDLDELDASVKPTPVRSHEHQGTEGQPATEEEGGEAAATAPEASIRGAA